MIEGMLKIFDRLAPLGRRKNSQVAAVVGFLTGGIGLGVYLVSFVDVVIPIGVVIVLTAVNVAPEVGWLAGAIVASIYGYLRVESSNARLPVEPETA